MAQTNSLITTEQLAAMLGRADLRVFDCTTYLEPAAEGSSEPYRVVPGRQTFEAGHVPGADFLDLQAEFSDRDTHLRFMMPPVPQLEQAFGRHGVNNNGVGNKSTVVLYSIGTMMWATRVWWMLRALGFAALVLDGGLDKWKAEGRALESGAPKGYPAATFTATPQPGMFVGKADVLEKLNAPDTVIVNALGPQFHRGLEPSRYGRPGRIPGSVNVSAATLIDPATKALTSLSDAETKFTQQGVTRDKNIVCYCGGGISATLDLFALAQLGYDKLTLYDASMGEWARDPSLPIETDRS
jgi:thiosulfate/3-mercaptopyruvate sulfurtransferase